MVSVLISVGTSLVCFTLKMTLLFTTPWLEKGVHQDDSPLVNKSDKALWIPLAAHGMTLTSVLELGQGQLSPSWMDRCRSHVACTSFSTGSPSD